jgi:hypothetical protein
MDKQELPINNPAERLYVILTRAAKSQKDNFSVVRALCLAMNLDVNDDNFIRGSNELLILVDTIEQKIKQYFSDRKKTSHLALTKEIKNYLVATIARQYSESSNEFIQKNTEYLFKSNLPILQAFNSCVEDFEEYGIKHGISINKDLLNELINDIDIWIKEIDSSQIDEDIKQFFIHKFMEIKHLLEKYCYHGSSRIKTEIYATMVEIGLYQEDLTEEKKEESRSFFKDSFEKLSKWAGIVNAPMNTVVIADKLLPMISQTAELVGHTVKQFLLPGS